MLPSLDTPPGQWRVRVLAAVRAAVILRILLSDYLGKWYGLILLIHIDLYSLALSTKHLNKNNTAEYGILETKGSQKYIPKTIFSIAFFTVLYR